MIDLFLFAPSLLPSQSPILRCGVLHRCYVPTSQSTALPITKIPVPPSEKAPDHSPADAMAEMIAISLSAKVAAALSRSTAVSLSSLVAIRSGIAAAARDLELLRAFLRFADSRHGTGTDSLASEWVDQIRSVGFELEDVADEYSFLSGGRSSFIRDCVNVSAWFALARRVRKARERLRDLTASKERYGIQLADHQASSFTADGGTVAATSRNLAVDAHFVEEDEIVGFAAHKRLLMEWVTGDSEPRRTHLAVFGMGGVGKTTLVTNVYKEVAANRYFDCVAWVSVSQNFKREDLLRTIAKELHLEVDNMDYLSLVKALRGHLSKKRYLLLLDDVWDAHAWYEIRNAFVDHGTRSRIIITTRSEDVASLAASTRIIMLEPLPKQEAWLLFCKTTFKQDDNRECPYHLKDWALKILDRCCGLPLAIVSVGNLLALKDRTEFAWKNIHDSLEWDGSLDRGIEQVSSILNLSIDDLPFHLRKCFLYCSIYPEDFFIKRKILIRLWIAEGFIEEKGQGTMEEIADDYLSQLVRRSLFHVMKKNEFGRAKRCCIHDLIRELIVRRSTKEGVFVFTKRTETWESSKKIRSLVIDRCKTDHLSAPKMTSLRSCNAFMAVLNASILSGFRLLTVLNLWLIRINTLPNSLTNLHNLRYLGIRSTLIEELPHDLGQLHNLQTLDAKWSRVQRLPDSITKLKSLRHLILFRRQSADFNSPTPGSAIEFPYGLQNLTSLQTLKYIEADDKMVKSLGSLKHMRSLELLCMHESSLVHLPSSISKMTSLLSLGIVSWDASVELDLETFYPAPLKLQRLALTGKVARGKFPSWFGDLSNLTQLQLCQSELEGDSIGLLSSLPRLLHLSLSNACKEKSLTFAEGCFPVLKKLSLHDMPNLSHIEFRKGSLIHLNVLVLRRCDGLTGVPQGMENLTRLKKMKLANMPSKITQKMQDRQLLGATSQDYQLTITATNLWHQNHPLFKWREFLDERRQAA